MTNGTTRWFARGVIVVGGLLLPPAEGGAEVVAVNVSPASPVVGQAATITITGQVPCGAVSIDFGDGVAQTYVVTNLPFSTPHVWMSTGSKTITASGLQGKCTGQASLTVQVIGGTQPRGIVELCAKITCGERPAMFSLKPEITSTFGFSTPGGILALAGTGFGSKSGSVVALLRTWTGGTVQKTLEVIEWTNTMVGVRWPAIAGVRHQTGTVALTNAGGGKSAPRSITFRPALEYKVLPLIDARVLSCATGGNFDQCNLVQDADDDPRVPANPGFAGNVLFGTPNPSILGRHCNTWGAVGNDTGTDVYQTALENDWALESFHWKVAVDGEQDLAQGSARKPTGFAKGTSWSPAVHWEVTPNDCVNYLILVVISGPAGVPHR